MLVKGKGSYVWDTDDKKYLDFSAGIAVNALGHADEGVLEVSSIVLSFKSLAFCVLCGLRPFCRFVMAGYSPSLRYDKTRDGYWVEMCGIAMGVIGSRMCIAPNREERFGRLP